MNIKGIIIFFLITFLVAICIPKTILFQMGIVGELLMGIMVIGTIIFLIMTFLTPLAILFQIYCGFFLVKYASHYVKNKRFSAEHQKFLVFCLVIVPIFMFIQTLLFTADSDLKKGNHWFYYIHDGWAGLVLLPVYLIASISLAKAIYNDSYLATSRENYVMIATLAAIAAWYTYATLALKLTIDGLLGELQILAIVPAITCFNYLILLKIIAKKAQLRPLNPLFAWVWFSTLIASVVAKYPLAKSFYEQPPKPPSYSCFVVSVAAQGHPWIVQSWINPNISKPVNRQWYIFKRFEAVLALHFPQIHRILRHIYNHVGPFIAKRIRYPWQADLVYLLLKPIEWAVFIVLKLTDRWVMRISYSKDDLQ